MKKQNAFLGILLLASLAAAPLHAKQDNDHQLPPGLQKKVEHGQALPPGWQKKLMKGEIMDKEVFRQSEIVVPLDRKGLLTVRIEGKLVKLFEATREIVEVLD